MRKLTIGELAKRGGVGVETVRYYQRKGLLPVPPRRQKGFREYPAATLASLRFIRRAKGLGFSLKEIAELLALRKAGATTCADLRPRLASKAAELQVRAEALLRTSASLAAMVKACEDTPAHVRCDAIGAIFPDEE
jgi:MerR family mercuric resistance operon transcriptional regulator